MSDKKNMSCKIEKDSNIKFNKLTYSIIEAMTKAVEKRDPYTSGHQLRVSKLAIAIAKNMSTPDEQMIEGIRIAGLVHDIGKICIPINILNRTGKISNHEFNIIRYHSQTGYDILQVIEFPWPVAEIVLQHHERLNGSGYPLGLKGETILLEAKILGVADVVEAMSSHRPYRQALGIDEALEEIEKGENTIYDTAVVDACIELFKNGFTFEDKRL